MNIRAVQANERERGMSSEAAARRSQQATGVKYIGGACGSGRGKESGHDGAGNALYDQPTTVNSEVSPFSNARSGDSKMRTAASSKGRGGPLSSQPGAFHTDNYSTSQHHHHQDQQLMESLGLSSSGMPERNSQAIYAKLNPSKSSRSGGENVKKEHKSNERMPRNQRDNMDGVK